MSRGCVKSQWKVIVAYIHESRRKVMFRKSQKNVRKQTGTKGYVDVIMMVSTGKDPGPPSLILRLDVRLGSYWFLCGCG
jgi:hypothetical protein